MKFAIRTLALGIAVSGLAASALSAHMSNNSALVNGKVTAVATQQILGASPIPVCYPTCKTNNGGMHR